jgi:hypothetical protein
MKKFVDHSTISTITAFNSIGMEMYTIAGKNSNSFASAAYPTANLAIFVPFTIYNYSVATQLFSYNGATASGNIDMGIYSADGTRLVSKGSTAQAGTSGLQAFDITDTGLAAGTYFLAVALDNTTGTLFSTTTGLLGFGIMMGLKQTASAFALPATVTFATISNDYVPYIGLTTRSVL